MGSTAEAVPQSGTSVLLGCVARDWWTFCHFGSKSAGTLSCTPAQVFIIIKNPNNIVECNSNSPLGKRQSNQLMWRHIKCDDIMYMDNVWLSAGNQQQNKGEAGLDELQHVMSSGPIRDSAEPACSRAQNRESKLNRGDC